MVEEARVVCPMWVDFVLFQEFVFESVTEVNDIDG